MKVDVVMPKMGESVNEGTIIKWHKKKGDKVEKDEIIFEISTDKVDTEIPSPEDGVLIDIKAYEQETVDVGTVVAVIQTSGGTDDSQEETEEQTEEKIEEEPASTTQVGGELVDIIMPKMGESVMEGTIIKWHKKVGDKIEKDEIIFEISTDKVDTEVPSPEAGILAEINVAENETVEVDTVVARLSTSGGIVKEKKSEPKKEQLAESKTEIKKEEPKEIKQQPGKDLSVGKSDRFYSPVVVNIARSENISFDELESLDGSGADGRVTKKDVMDYLETRKGGGAAQPSQSKPKVQQTAAEKSEDAKFSAGEGIELIPMDNIRKRIMYHMVNSRDTSVHVTAVLEADVSKIHTFIQENRERFLQNTGVKLTYMPFIAYACIKALQKYPYVNASIDENNIVLKKFINLGIAVAVEPNGLIVPNIKKADEKSILGLTKAILELSNKSRGKGLTPDDIMDGTFTITNYGVFGSLFGTPIINQPEVGILGIGAVQKKPVVVEVDGTDSIAIKSMMYLSLSHDHRLVDGMLGGKFLIEIKDALENFDTNLV
ncbi:MAG: 2-oxoglutarate dehydrogenase, E2 component, dihydrolipoamide succinyltransferase [Melioribacteraceae bacterium]|nr:2-oxoglutarate dehydrogenase, E2 component, dihydrolipoamide succinyltransferase [Melioribacteraceae bacterium]MCF8355096.1 2-oxoglutarate dehydrogenase, E2 component, dihydrolipoamide succinyltransferase [Melioribacteraceae bacterium]MCF8395064.1 2-oxoglutarate dehydrogenase, E2 component, dihydrolipoamide succinyltransferase [Melioribacteraceae bacterium]MCF8420314.1 2-oxoglutarate dehydrogenase, E2 component, dihydrolipoamide succinyltransferase [Melioribacteraceae bacterium]